MFHPGRILFDTLHLIHQGLYLKVHHILRHFREKKGHSVRDGLVNTSEYIDKIYPLSQIQEAFEERDDKTKDSIHIVIDVEK